MSRSLRAVIGLATAVALAGCAVFSRKPPQEASALQTGGILTIEPGVAVLARSVMPLGFAPLAYHPPMWLNHGRDVGVVGTFHGRTTLVDFGIGNQQPRVLIADTSDAVLADIEPSPDGSAIAVALARSGGRRIEVVRFDVATHKESSVAEIDRGFESLSMGWPTADKIALAIKEPPRKAEQAEQPDQDRPKEDHPARSDTAFDLYLIPVKTPGKPARVTFNCALSPLAWSSDGSYAVAQGEGAAPPILLDLDRKRCAPLNVPGPIDVLTWAPKGASFIYAGPTPGGSLNSVFQFDIATARALPLAISSSAAAYVSDTLMVALGNHELTRQRVAEQPQATATAEVALMDPSQGSIKISSLGLLTSAEMLASSTMVYSPVSAMAAIELYAPGAIAPLRRIVAFSTKNARETLLATGPAAGLVLMAWSPDGTTLALFHGNAKVSELTLLVPESNGAPIARPQAAADTSSSAAPAPPAFASPPPPY